MEKPSRKKLIIRWPLSKSFPHEAFMLHAIKQFVEILLTSKLKVVSCAAKHSRTRDTTVCYIREQSSTHLKSTVNDFLPSRNQALCEYCTHVSKLKHCCYFN